VTTEKAATTAITVEAVVEQQGQNPLVRIDAVMVRVNGESTTAWHTNMMPAGDGSYLLYLHHEMRKAASVSVGDVVIIDVIFDAAYRNGPLHALPSWFEGPLATSPTASVNWQRLSPSRQKEVLRYFAGLKSDEAKDRNLERVMRVLEGANERFMGRDWRDGA